MSDRVGNQNCWFSHATGLLAFTKLWYELHHEKTRLLQIKKTMNLGFTVTAQLLIDEAPFGRFCCFLDLSTFLIKISNL